MSKLTSFMDRIFYPEHSSNWDDALFRDQLLNVMKEDSVCLEYGCGRGNVEQMNFKGKVQLVVGVDVSAEVFKNPYLDEAKKMDFPDCRLPFSDNKFDIIFADNVMEHVSDSVVTLTELSRVLKPGGLLLFKTPNKWHYMPLIARFSPTWFHKYYNGLRGRDADDTFPTKYVLNSTRDIRKACEASGLKVNDINFVEGRPEYLRLFFLTYLVGLACERLVNSTKILIPFRCVIFAEIEKID